MADLKTTREETSGPYHKDHFNGIRTSLARIEDASISKGRNGETIINIQDCHASLSSQYSIVNVLEELFTEYDLDVVAVEGGSGYVDTSILKSLPDRDLRKKTADMLMKKSYISAGEFFAMTNENDIALYGVEDQGLYRENVDVFRSIYSKRGDCVRAINSLLQAMAGKEAAVYDNDLRRFIFKKQLHLESSISVSVYWKFLQQVSERNDISSDDAVTLRSFMQLVKLEKSIDFDKATEGRKKIINNLIKEMNSVEIEALVKRTLAFEEGRLAKPVYYRQLLEEAKEAGMDPALYPDLSKYVEYTEKYWQLDLVRLHLELKRAEDRLIEALVNSDLQREYFKYRRFLENIRSLFMVKLSGEEVAGLKEDMREISASDLKDFLKREKIDVTKEDPAEGADIEKLFAAAGKDLVFYDIASKRNEKLIANTVKCMRREGRKVAALIAGGYHSRGLTSVMKEKGFSYLVLLPRTSEQEDRPYVAVLTKKPDPYRRVKDKDYELALEVGLTRDIDHLQAMIAYVVGVTVLRGEDAENMVKKWLSLIETSRQATPSHRMEAAERELFDLDKIHGWFTGVDYNLRTSPAGREECVVSIGEQRFLVSDNDVVELRGRDDRRGRKIGISDLFEKAKNFSRNFTGFLERDDSSEKFSFQISPLAMFFFSLYEKVVNEVSSSLDSILQKMARTKKKSVNVLLVNLFNAEGRHLTIGFPISVESLAGDLRGKYGKKVNVDIIDMQLGENVDDVIKAVRENDYDIMGMSIKTGEREVAREILDRLYSEEIDDEDLPSYVVAGGHRPRVYIDDFLNEYNKVLVCQGEGEPTLRGLVELQLGKRQNIKEVPNLRYFEKRGAVKEITETKWEELDISEYSPPSIDTLKEVIRRGGIVYWESSRGCSWGRCRFCNRYYCRHTTRRLVPPEKLLEGLRKLSDIAVSDEQRPNEKKTVKVVFFADTDFFQNDPARMKEMARGIISDKEAGLIREDIVFWVQTRASGLYVDPVRKDGTVDERAVERNKERAEALELLRKAGLGKVFLGVESGSPSQLSRYSKGVGVRSLEGAISLCRDLDLELEIGLIPVGPFMTLKELRETVEFVEEQKIEDSIVKVLNVMCIEEGSEYFKMVRRAELITGPKNIETLLYPYRMKDSRLDVIKEVAADWMGENDHFVYALRRIVDASEVGSRAEHNLFNFRRIDFSLLKGLVHITAVSCSDDIAEQRQQIEEMKKIEYLDKRRVEDLAQILETYIDTPNKRKKQIILDHSFSMLLDIVRSARDQALDNIESDIGKGYIKGPVEFLVKGIKKIRKNSAQGEQTAVLPRQDKFKIIVGLPSVSYDIVGERKIRELISDLSISDIVRLSSGDDQFMAAKERSESLIEELKGRTSRTRSISVLIDSAQDLERAEDIEEVIRDFIDKVREDIATYLDPVIPLEEEDISRMKEIDVVEDGRRRVLDILVRRHPYENSLRLDEKSIYDLRIEEIRESLKERDYSAVVKGFSPAAGDPESSRRFMVTSVDKLIDLKLLAGSIRERREEMRLSRDGNNDPVKDFILMKNSLVNKENIESILERTGLAGLNISTEQIILLEENESMDLVGLREKMSARAVSLWPEETFIQWKDIAFAEKANILGIDQDSLSEYVDAGSGDPLLYVRLGSYNGSTSGVVSQLYKMTVEIMAHGDKVKYFSDVQIVEKDGTLYYVYIPKAKVFDYEQEAVNYRSYVMRSL
jgi:radical SAM superfamily enzyme YgiQ (UPF0313 family)